MQSAKSHGRMEAVVAVIRIGAVILGVYWLAIFVATHLPAPVLPTIGSDKLYHMAAFSGLSFLLSWSFSAKFRSAAQLVLTVVSVTLLYAMFDEWSQQFVAGRQPDVEDVVADLAGTLIGLTAYFTARAIVRSLYGPSWRFELRSERSE